MKLQLQPMRQNALFTMHFNLPCFDLNPYGLYLDNNAQDPSTEVSARS